MGAPATPAGSQPYVVPQGATFGYSAPPPAMPDDNSLPANTEQAYAADYVEQVVRETVPSAKPEPDDNPEITAEVEALLAQIMGNKGEGGAENNEQK